MKNILHFAIAGVIAVALMAMFKLLLSGQAVLVAQWHYPPFSLQGQDGLRKLATFAVWGAGYAVAYSLLLKSLLPGGFILGPLALGAIPTLVAALVLPLYYGGVALKEPWTLLWLYAHWSTWAACFLFIAGGKGKGAKRGGGDE
jgi:hypothetical protein